MIDWLKIITQNYPEFWKMYLKNYSSKSNRYVIFTLETTGLNTEKDVILSISAIASIDNKVIMEDQFEVAIDQKNYFIQNKLLHSKAENLQQEMTEEAAMEAFVNFVGDATLIGHRVNFDIEIINHALNKMGCGNLKNEALDIEIMHQKNMDLIDVHFAINDLAKFYKIPIPEKSSISSDTFILSILFLKLKQKLGIK